MSENPARVRPLAWLGLALATLLVSIVVGLGVNVIAGTGSTPTDSQEPQGSPGAAGPQGPQGPAGAAGPAGATGAKGAPGPSGPVGATGAQGPQGPRGAAGTAGAPGVRGADGSQGVAGQPGAVGAAGDPGEAGAVGPHGATGAKGATGPSGAAGAPGPQGAAGPTGPAGPGRVVTVSAQGSNVRELSSGVLSGLAPGVWAITSTMLFDARAISKYDCTLTTTVNGNVSEQLIARGEFVVTDTETFVATRVIEILPNQNATFETECGLELEREAHSMTMSTSATAAVLQGVGG